MKKLRRVFALAVCLLFSTGLSSCIPASAEVELKSPAWDHIISLVVGKGFTVGLRSDGRVAYAGDNDSEEIQKIGLWEDIVRIEHCGEHSPYVVGYHTDGSVVLAYLDEVRAITAREYDNDNDYQTWFGNRWRETDFEGWTGIKSLILDYYFALGLRYDGTVLVVTREDNQKPEIQEKLLTIKETVESWESVIQIETLGGDLFRYGQGNYFEVVDAFKDDNTFHVGHLAVGLKENGEVVCTENTWLESQGEDSVNDFLQPWPKSSEWNRVKELVRGRYGSSMRPFLFGIREDGTVFGVAEGHTVPLFESKQFVGYDKIPYDHIRSMCFAMNEICLLRDNGTVYVLSEIDWEVWEEIREWTDVVQLTGGTKGQFAAEGVPIGLKGDGTVLATGSVAEKVAAWDHIEKLYTGAHYLIGIRNDGKVFSCPADTELDMWNDISEILPSNSGWWSEIEHYVGLKKDGTVVAAGDNTYGQCQVSIQN